MHFIIFLTLGSKGIGIGMSPSLEISAVLMHAHEHLQRHMRLHGDGVRLISALLIQTVTLSVGGGVLFQCQFSAHRCAEWCR